MEDKPVDSLETADPALASAAPAVLAVIAVDGPAASGKSTVAFIAAQKLDFLFFDSGVMYRAVAWAALDRGVSIADEAAVTALAEQADIDVLAPSEHEQDGRQCTVLLDGADITWATRSPDVDQSVSTVSAYPAVRRALVQQQRRIGLRYGRGEADRPGIVMVGRDIGTVVLPEAGLKIYLDAAPEERARRRYLERLHRGEAVVYEHVLQDIIRRDRLDSERAHSPLRAADNAVVIDSSHLTPEEVAGQIVVLARSRLT